MKHYSPKFKSDYLNNLSTSCQGETFTRQELQKLMSDGPISNGLLNWLIAKNKFRKFTVECKIHYSFKTYTEDDIQAYLDYNNSNQKRAKLIKMEHADKDICNSMNILRDCVKAGQLTTRILNFFAKNLRENGYEVKKIKE